MAVFWANLSHPQVNSETRSQQEHNVVYSVEPKTGSSVVFRHELLHEVQRMRVRVRLCVRTTLVL